MKYKDMSKQEKLAWLALVIFAAASAYLGWRLFVADLIYGHSFGQKTAQRASYAFFSFLVGYYFIKRKDNSAFVDERDKQIALKRIEAGYLSLGLMLVFAVTVVGLESYEVFFNSLSPSWVEGLLMLMLMSSVAIHSMVGVVCYWRDRR
jgi:succinate dehydrogenase/fumarate reductase cytochrome b subunit